MALRVWDGSPRNSNRGHLTREHWPRRGRRSPWTLRGSRGRGIEALRPPEGGGTEYELQMRNSYKANSLTVIFSGLNYYLGWIEARDSPGEALKFKPPKREIPENPRILNDREYQALLKVADHTEELMLRLLRESGWRPVDIAGLEVKNIGNGFVEQTSQKTKVTAKAFLTADTMDLLRMHVSRMKPVTYVFETRTGRRPHRRFPLELVARVAHRAGIHGLTPKAFTKCLASGWPDDDIAGLMRQRGWAEVSTVYRYYKRASDQRQKASLDQAMGIREDPEDLPGYR